MDVNPFQPPRAPGGDGGSVGDASGGTLPEAAWQALVQSAPWARWACILNLVGAGLAVVQVLVAVARAGSKAETAGQIGSLALTVPLAIFFAVIYRRFAREARRLGERQPGALTGVLEAQQTIFKVYGVLVILGLVLMGLVVLAAVLFGLFFKR